MIVCERWYSAVFIDMSFIDFR